MPAMRTTEWDAVVIGGGHNGLVCAAYLARAGARTLVVEARSTVGGTAATDVFAGGRANVCNCDHITFRTTPVIDELGLADHGLRYLNVEPAQINATWAGGAAWASYHDVDATVESIAATHPTEVDGYRRYLADAVPAVRLVLDAANDPPSAARLGRALVDARGRGAATLLRWSRRSAADVMRHYFATEALRAPGLGVGPMVWGISPETPRSGLGALTYALRHVGRLGRPVGGSGMVPDALLASFLAHGGQVRTSTAVTAIDCLGSVDGGRVRGVVLADGTEITANVVVSACNPHDTFLRWLTNPPPNAAKLIHRWRHINHPDGYESKIDAVVQSPPVVAAIPDAALARHGDALGGTTTVIAPTLDEMHRAHRLAADGAVASRPLMIANTASAIDPTMRTPDGRHMLSLEVLFTPYRLVGGWAHSREPQRWLDLFGAAQRDDFVGGLGEHRVMTPDRYEQEFSLPAGHATSFSGGPLAALRHRNPELTRYRTAIAGLYLTGAATFPGAGVWGASGRNAAMTILADIG